MKKRNQVKPPLVIPVDPRKVYFGKQRRAESDQEKVKDVEGDLDALVCKDFSCPI